MANENELQNGNITNLNTVDPDLQFTNTGENANDDEISTNSVELPKTRDFPEDVKDVIEDTIPEHESQDSKRFRYGWFCMQAECLQWMNNALVFLILMTFSNIFHQGITRGLIGSVQTSLESRFQLTSTQSSTLMIAYEAFDIPLSLFIAYKGTVGCHRPKWTSAFLLVSCIGCLLHALPHFTTPEYAPTEDNVNDNLCGSFQSNNSSCEGRRDNIVDSSLQKYLGVFIVSRMCFTFGTVLLNLAVTFLDDCLTREKFSLYSSVFVLGGIFGPAMGYILGGVFVEMYTDFPTVDVETDIDFGPNDPRWIGAWWLGFLVFGAGLLLTVLAMSGYPSDLPGAAEIRRNKVNEASGTEEDPSLTKLRFDFKLNDVKRLSKELFTNWSWLCLSLFVSCDSMIVGGVSLFAPKFLEVQYAMTSGLAGIVMGALVVPAGAVGAITAGIVMERLKLTYTSIVKTEFFVSILVCLMGFMFLTTCKQTDFAGVNVAYGNSSNIDLVDSCNTNCSCLNQFNPVCSNQNIQYLSPCHAGCTDLVQTNDKKLYYNCTCIHTENVTMTSDATGGICSTSDCTEKIAIFGVLLVIAMIGIFFCETMNLSAIIRVVPNSHRLFALVCTSIITKLVGAIPGPLLYGFVFDSGCLLWQEDCNGENGSCYYYNNNKVGLYIFITSTSVKVASVIFVLLAWQLYKPPKNTDVTKTIKTIENDFHVMDHGSNCRNGTVNSGFQTEQNKGRPENHTDEDRNCESGYNTKL